MSSVTFTTNHEVAYGKLFQCSNESCYFVTRSKQENPICLWCKSALVLMATTYPNSETKYVNPKGYYVK